MDIFQGMFRLIGFIMKSHILPELTFQFVSTILNNKLKEEGTTVENAHVKSGKAEKVQ